LFFVLSNTKIQLDFCAQRNEVSSGIARDEMGKF